MEKQEENKRPSSSGPAVDLPRRPSLPERLISFYRGIRSGPGRREELTESLREASNEGVIPADSQAMMEGLLGFGDLQVRDIMVSRSQIISINKDQNIEDFLPTIISSGHSRFPVIGDSKDEVVGVLLAKDVLRFWIPERLKRGRGSREGTKDWREALRKPVFIPESKRLNDLLREFRVDRYHMAVVVDEYGGVSGLVTIEDVLEEIVGEIDDEHDTKQEANIRRHDDIDCYSVRGLTPIEEFNSELGKSFEANGYDTVGGLLMKESGHVPVVGERIAIEDIEFEVTAADSRRIFMIKVVRRSAAPAEKGSGFDQS